MSAYRVAGLLSAIKGPAENFDELPSPRVAELPEDTVDLVVFRSWSPAQPQHLFAHVRTPVQAVALVSLGVEVIRVTGRGQIMVFRDAQTSRWVARFQGKGESAHDTAVEHAGALADWLGFWWGQLQGD